MARTYPLPTMRAARTGQGHSHVGRIGAQPVSSTDSATAVKVAPPTPPWSTSPPPPTKTGPVDSGRAARPC